MNDEIQSLGKCMYIVETWNENVVYAVFKDSKINNK